MVKLARFYPRPSSRESTIIYGDGDEAVFLTVGTSTQKGHLYFKLRPTPQMRWKKQILDDQYDPNDKWINRIYKSDLCIPLSTDPDFGMWLILCDYFGNEDTPLFNYFVKSKQLILRNRDLEKENLIYRAKINKMDLIARKRAIHPEEYVRELLNNVSYINEAAKPPVLMPTPNSPTGEPYPGEEN